MPRIPVTGQLWYDAGLALALFIAGVMVAMKAENKLGWVASLVALLWAYLLFKPLT